MIDSERDKQSANLLRSALASNRALTRYLELREETRDSKIDELLAEMRIIVNQNLDARLKSIEDERKQLEGVVKFIKTLPKVILWFGGLIGFAILWYETTFRGKH